MRDSKYIEHYVTAVKRDLKLSDYEVIARQNKKILDLEEEIKRSQNNYNKYEDLRKKGKIINEEHQRARLDAIKKFTERALPFRKAVIDYLQK